MAMVTALPVSSAVVSYVFINQLISTGTQIITQVIPYPITAVTQLSIAPRINGDGTITMMVNQQITSQGAFQTAPDGSEYPNYSIEQIQVVARVKSGETIVLGGMVSKNDNATILKFPILGDLPFIGQFFTKRGYKKDDSELLIFVTPTIVEDDTNGGLAP